MIFSETAKCEHKDTADYLASFNQFVLHIDFGNFGRAHAVKTYRCRLTCMIADTFDLHVLVSTASSMLVRYRSFFYHL